jgi:hypothetical protein
VPRAWRCRPNRGVLDAVGLLDHHRDGNLGVGALTVRWAVQLEVWRFRLPRADSGRRDGGVLGLPDD